MKDIHSGESDTDRLTAQIRNLIRSQSYTRSFIRGVFSGLGYVVGATIVVATIAWFLSFIPVVPIIGSWLAEIVISAQNQLLLR